MKRYALQTRFHSEHYTQPWLTIGHSATQAGAENMLSWHVGIVPPGSVGKVFTNPKCNTCEYRIIPETVK